MNLEYQAILSLNTRVRRLRYMYQAVTFVSDTAMSRQLLVHQLLEYALSRSLYDQIVRSPSEPFSGHFFENLSHSYERNMERRSKRRKSNADRVAESYIDLGMKLALLVESGQRISASQLSLPIRFIAHSRWLSASQQIECRSRYTLALLIRFDRDLTCPMLARLLQEPAGIKIEEVEDQWTTWEKHWLEKLIEAAGPHNLGNPAALLRHLRTATKSRKKPTRYAEHTALIRFHWLLDLNIASGHPPRNPVNFAPNIPRSAPIHRFLAGSCPQLVRGDTSEIHFEISKTTSRPQQFQPPAEFSQVMADLLQTARNRGSSNIRLSLLDIIWTMLAATSGELPENYRDFCQNVDSLLKSQGVTVIKAPSREETYIPTRQ